MPVYSSCTVSGCLLWVHLRHHCLLWVHLRHHCLLWVEPAKCLPFPLKNDEHTTACTYSLAGRKILINNRISLFTLLNVRTLKFWKILILQLKISHHICFYFDLFSCLTAGRCFNYTTFVYSISYLLCVFISLHIIFMSLYLLYWFKVFLKFNCLN